MTVHQHQNNVHAQIQPQRLALTSPGADVAVFSLDDTKLVDESMTLTPSAEGIALSQGVFFLGYPLPDRVPLGSTLPFVKQGILSQNALIGGVNVWWIDGMNNPGFSGGPVVFNRGGVGNVNWQVMGIVTGYVTQEIAVAGGLPGLAGLVPTNSGIIMAYDIKHATDAIDAFVANESS